MELPCPGRDGLRPTTPLYLRTSPGRCAPRSGRRPVGERPPRGIIWLRERRQRRPARAGTGCARGRSELTLGPVRSQRASYAATRAHLGVSARADIVRVRAALSLTSDGREPAAVASNCTGDTPRRTGPVL